MLSYAVPTQRIVVELYFDHREARRGTLFLAGGQDSGHGVASLLEESGPFLPFADAEEQAVSLVHRDALLQAVLLFAPAEVEAPPPWTRHQAVRVELRDGPSLEADLLYSPPEGRARLSDHLNEPTRFLLLEREGRLHFVNKAHVIRVVELAQVADAEGER